MKISHALVTRPQYYDRNPTTSRILYSAAGVAPHGQTTRASYTVPTGRKALVDTALVEIIRATVAGVAGGYLNDVQYSMAGALIAHGCRASSADNTAGARVQNTTSQMGLFIAGDSLQIITSDSSTGGTINYEATAKYNEFDA